MIKVERPEGDFGRYYDGFAHGECSYFVWLNRGKELVVLDLGKADDKALLEAMLKRADIFVQNLKPGTIGKLGFPIARLRRDYPRLICCSISGFGDSGPFANAQGLRSADLSGSWAWRRSPARQSRRASAYRWSMFRPE